MQYQKDTNKQMWTLKGRCKWSVWVFSCYLFSSSLFKIQSNKWLSGLLVDTLGSRWGEEPQEQQGQYKSSDERLGGLAAKQVSDTASHRWRATPTWWTHTLAYSFTARASSVNLHLTVLTTLFLLSICLLRCRNWEGQQVSQNEARCSWKRG